jgi:hypothetical protein
MYNIRRLLDSHRRACRIKSLNSEKDLRFLFKIVNRFSKIKEVFTVKLKMIFVGHHFQLYQTLNNI